MLVLSVGSWRGLSVLVRISIVIVIVVVAGECLLDEIDFVCFHGCPVWSKFLFVYLLWSLYLYARVSFCWLMMVSYSSSRMDLVQCYFFVCDCILGVVCIRIALLSC